MRHTGGTGPRRFVQADREAVFTLALYCTYFIWWYAFGYGLGGGDPQDYTYICGFPAWFFFSCIAGFPVVSLCLWIVLRLFFRNMPLDPRPREETPADLSPGPGPVRN
jgi:uncharacterized membrane protein YhdT